MSVPQIPEHPGEGVDMTGGTSVDPGNAATETAQHQALMDAAEQEIEDRHTAYGRDSGAIPDGMDSMLSWAQDDVPDA